MKNIIPKCILCFTLIAISFFYSHSVMAASSAKINASSIQVIPKSKYEKIATFANSNYMTQGGTIVGNYYVFTDCGSGSGRGHCTEKKSSTLHIVDRMTCKQKKVNFNYGYISGIYNKKGTNNISFVKLNQVVGCMKITKGTAKKISKNNCSSVQRVIIDELIKGGGKTVTQGTAVEFNGYKFQVGGLTKQKHPIVIFRKNSSVPVAVFELEQKFHEPEGISIDASTGDVYITFNQRHKNDRTKSSSYFIKIDSSVFKKYTGISKAGKAYPKCNGYNNPVDSKATKAAKKNSSTPSQPSQPSNSGSSNNQQQSNNSNTSSNTKSNTNTSSSSDSGYQSIFFGEIKKNDKGCGVFKVLFFVVDIMSIGVGILAVIGISVLGVQYLTAGGNVEKATKARKRILEIIIGVAVYALLYTIINWLLPGGNINENQCARIHTDTNKEITII